MGWLTIAYSMTAAACLTLAAVHLLVWFKRPARRAHLAFSLTAISVAAIAPFELAMARAQTAEQFIFALRWFHIPAGLTIVSVVWFAWAYFGAGRRWLAIAVCGLRVLVLILNFSLTENINFREITGVTKVVLIGGETASAPIGVLNPWHAIAQLSNFLFLLYILDVTITLWRRGDQIERRRAVLVGSSLVFFALVVGNYAVLLVAGFVTPFFVALPFLAFVAAMGYELSLDIVNAGQAEEAKRNLATIVESSDDAILSKTLDGTITTWNAGAERIYGYSTSEIVGQHVSILAPAERKEEVTRVLEQLRCGEKVDHLETVRVTRDGRRIDVSLTISPIKDEHGIVIGASTIARDITQRKQAEMETRRQRSELAHLSRVTTLGELSGSLAHELNQPLGAILRNTEAAELFLQDPSPDLEELRAIMTDIRKDDQRAAALIDRMRSIAKRREVEASLLDLNLLVSEVIGLVKPEVDTRKVQLTFKAASSLPPVSGDRIQLQQVLLNLLLNAMDAVNDSELDRRLVTVRVQPGGKSVEVAVSDTGQGIPTDKLAHIFDPFFTTKLNGMGMGLAISRTIIEAHGGTIRAENNPDGGATFYFTLAVAMEESAS